MGLWALPHEETMSKIWKNSLVLLMMIGFGVVLSDAAPAACICRCVNGQVVPLCESAIEVPPVCSPLGCPLVPPSIAPLQPPTLPPLGTKTCKQEQVYNKHTQQYEWKEICY